jgi:glucosamine kinase
VKLIAESGSTKTIWVLLDVDNQEVWRKPTIGLNPFFVESDEVSSVFKEMLGNESTEQIQDVFFYGASCSSDERNLRISAGINAVLPKAKVTVNHDLLAAARALCRNKPGIACILGTGSNSCEYDGKNITDNVPSMGFMIGDEGSGSSIGRRLVRSWIYREMPVELVEEFTTSFDITKESVLTSLYYNEKPNKFLASLSRFCLDHINHPLIQEILAESFKEFIDRHISKYASAREVPIHFVGSIAFYYQDALKQELEKANMKLGLVIQSPIDELIKYHR